MKVREILRILEEDGWYLARTKGSHRQYKHPIKSGTVTIAGKPSLDMPIGTLKSIWRQAQLLEAGTETEQAEDRESEPEEHTETGEQ